MLEPRIKGPRRGAKQDRREVAETQILEAALQIVSTRGSNLMTLADVGVKAGYSRGLPGHYFGNKEGLIREMTAYLARRFVRRFQHKPTQNEGISAVVRRVRDYVETAAADPAQVRVVQILFSEAVTGTHSAEVTKSLVESSRHSIDYFEAPIAAGIASGEIDPSINPRGAATVIMGAARGVVQQWFMDPKGCPREEWEDAFYLMVKAALTPQGGPQKPPARAGRVRVNGKNPKHTGVSS